MRYTDRTVIEAIRHLGTPTTRDILLAIDPHVGNPSVCPSEAYNALKSLSRQLGNLERWSIVKSSVFSRRWKAWTVVE